MRTSLGLILRLLVVLAVASVASAGNDECPAPEGGCLESHDLGGCTDETCCNTVCDFDPFCCGSWDEGCVDLADTTCVGLCGASVSGDCFAVNGSASCNDAECCQQVCLADPFCCDQSWDTNCVLFAGFLCTVAGGECGDPDAGACDVANGTPACADQECCEDVCAIDPSCCDAAWDVFCVEFADAACGAPCPVSSASSDAVELEGCEGRKPGPPNDPCDGGEAEQVDPTRPIVGSFRSETDVDVLAFDLSTFDDDGDGLVRLRLSLDASRARAVLRSPDCPGESSLEIDASACIQNTIVACVDAAAWHLAIEPTGAVPPCEEVGWRIVMEIADTCGQVCGRPESCLVPHAHPGCADTTCCDAVCAVDPACCDWTWDSACAVQAARTCGGDPPPNDQCEQATLVTTGDHPFTQLLAGTSGPEAPCLAPRAVRNGDLWFRYVADCDGDILVGTCSVADFDTVVDVFQGRCGSLASVACIDDDAFCTFDTASVFVQVACGEEYLIRVSGVDGAVGNGALSIQCFAAPCSSCPADLDGDGTVGGSDFGLLLSAWGPCGGTPCDADLDGDGEVGGPDLGFLLAVWGDC